MTNTDFPTPAFAPPPPRKFEVDDPVWVGMDNLVHLVIEDEDGSSVAACVDADGTDFGRLVSIAMLASTSTRIVTWRSGKKELAGRHACQPCLDARDTLTSSDPWPAAARD